MNPWCVCVLKVGLNIGHPNEPLVCVCVEVGGKSCAEQVCEALPTQQRLCSQAMWEEGHMAWE